MSRTARRDPARLLRRRPVLAGAAAAVVIPAGFALLAADVGAVAAPLLVAGYLLLLPAALLP